MSDNVRRDNRRALPKYLLTILLFDLLSAHHWKTGREIQRAA